MARLMKPYANLLLGRPAVGGRPELHAGVTVLMLDGLLISWAGTATSPAARALLHAACIRVIPSPGFPRRLAGVPKLFKLVLIAECVHGLPKTVVEERLNLSSGDQGLDDLSLEHPVVVLDL